MYILAAVHLYFLCEWLKTTGLTPVRDDRHYHTCIAFFKQDLTEDVTRRVCDMLNHEENFTKFVKNAMYMLLVLYALTGRIIDDYRHFDPLYWAVAFVVSIGYSFLNNISYFQFSIQNNTVMSYPRVVICALVGIVCIALLLRQWWTKRIRYRLLLVPGLTYVGMLGLFWSASAVSWHLHHVIAAGLFSLCFTDFEVYMNRFIHAACIGMIVQGLNYYTVEELFLFNIGYHPPPSFGYMSALVAGATACSLLYYYAWNKMKKRKEKDRLTDDPLYIQLIPRL